MTKFLKPLENGDINENSDVYSFGDVLMELITGKMPLELEFRENKDMVYMIYSKLENKGNLVEMLNLNISYDLKEDAIRGVTNRSPLHCKDSDTRTEHERYS
ncbi:hypothetical protein GQ457_06G001600 [Hibiscus cannabinus]